VAAVHAAAPATWIATSAAGTPVKNCTVPTNPCASTKTRSTPSRSSTGRGARTAETGCAKNRRESRLHPAGAASAAVPAMARAQGPGAAPAKAALNPVPVRVGMTDWNLGQRGDIAKVTLAREIGLDGIQVSLQFPTDGKTPTLRDPKTQEAFRRAALDNGIQIC
jgi:hypothetical protein